MMKKISLLTMIIAISIMFGSAQSNNQTQKQGNMVLEYSDGSGNCYKITSDSIIYKPITREMSSSGVYDGGEPVQKSITNEGFRKVRIEFDMIFKETSIHIKHRIKTSGCLIMNKGLDNERKVIIERSDEQLKLEKLLKLLLSD